MTPLLLVSMLTLVVSLIASTHEYRRAQDRAVFDLMRAGVAMGAFGVASSLVFYIEPRLVLGFVSEKVPMANLTLVMFCGIESAWFLLAFFRIQAARGKHPLKVDRDGVEQIQAAVSDLRTELNEKREAAVADLRAETRQTAAELKVATEAIARTLADRGERTGT